MERPIMRQQFLLSRPARIATADDLAVAQDLKDTLEANRFRCIGMAANMIGVPVAIICVLDEKGSPLTMLNPSIVRTRGRYETEEGCLSLEGMRPCVRYRTIWVEWQDADLCERSGRFTGSVAEAIQHECDHLAGIII